MRETNCLITGKRPTRVNRITQFVFRTTRAVVSPNKLLAHSLSLFFTSMCTTIAMNEYADDVIRRGGARNGWKAEELNIVAVLMLRGCLSIHAGVLLLTRWAGWGGEGIKCRCWPMSQQSWNLCVMASRGPLLTCVAAVSVCVLWQWWCQGRSSWRLATLSDGHCR
jgi:hypothetical protein